MSYTWGYIKNATLAKLDLSVDSAIEEGFLNKFVVYANEAMTQICSAVRPKYDYARFKVRKKKDVLTAYERAYNIDLSFLEVTNPSIIKTFTELQRALYNAYHSFTFTGELVNMPEDFISFGSDVNTVITDEGTEEADDDSFDYKGNKLVFYEPGDYSISYNARWCFFTPTMSEETKIDAPADVLDCIPSYIASQCFKIDDEAKASIMRNEFELMLARIDDTHYMQNGTIIIKGGW